MKDVFGLIISGTEDQELRDLTMIRSLAAVPIAGSGELRAGRAAPIPSANAVSGCSGPSLEPRVEAAAMTVATPAKRIAPRIQVIGDRHHV